MKTGDANNQISNLVGNYDNKEARGFDKPPAYYKSQNKMSSTYYTILQGAAQDTKITFCENLQTIIF